MAFQELFELQLQKQKQQQQQKTTIHAVRYIIYPKLQKQLKTNRKMLLEFHALTCFQNLKTYCSTCCYDVQKFFCKTQQHLLSVCKDFQICARTGKYEILSTFFNNTYIIHMYTYHFTYAQNISHAKYQQVIFIEEILEKPTISVKKAITV